MSVALSAFEGDDLADAMGVPLYYGMVEALVVGSYCMVAWKLNWTKAPPNEPFMKVVSTSYEVLYAEILERKNLEIEMTASEDGKAPPSPPSSDYIQVEENEVANFRLPLST